MTETAQDEHVSVDPNGFQPNPQLYHSLSAPFKSPEDFMEAADTIHKGLVPLRITANMPEVIVVCAGKVELPSGDITDCIVIGGYGDVNKRIDLLLQAVQEELRARGFHDKAINTAFNLMLDTLQQEEMQFATFRPAHQPNPDGTRPESSP